MNHVKIINHVKSCGRHSLIKAIDRYIEKADVDLSKTLDDAKGCFPKESGAWVHCIKGNGICRFIILFRG